MQCTRDCDHVVSQGTLRDGESRVDYYTTVPTPSQWIAVGVLVSSDTEDPVRRPRRMLVGTGRCEETAVADLEKRFVRLLRERAPQEARQEATLVAAGRDKGEPVRQAVVDDAMNDSRLGTETEGSRI